MFYTILQGSGSKHFLGDSGYKHYSRVLVLYTTPGFRFYTLYSMVQVLYTTQGSGNIQFSTVQVLYTAPGFRF